MLKYSLARVGLFVVCFLVVWAVWLRGLEPDPGRLMKTLPDQVLIAMVIAAVSSMVLSIWLLRGLRAAASDRINARVTHSLQERAARRNEIGEDEAAEDAEDDVAAHEAAEDEAASEAGPARRD